jgi:hypothetical protein
MDANLEKEIKELEVILNEKKRQLFINRLQTICGRKFANSNISSIKINVNSGPDPLEWCISYEHKTNNYKESAYSVASSNTTDDEEAAPHVYKEDGEDNTGIAKSSTITFGKSAKYYIKGGRKFAIYRNAANELRIINKDYEYDLDLDEQHALINKYTENTDIPEWMAIKIFLYLSDNKWSDEDFIIHLSIV